MSVNFSNLTFSSSDWDVIRQTFFANARDLEKAQFSFLFEQQSELPIIQALRTFQNHDGGFGHGLEPDFHLPDSTPMATSIGLRILAGLPQSPERDELILPALKFLKGSFYLDRKGWYAVTPRVNAYPHAPWWEFDLKTNATPIDQNWGNPTAEILAYLWKFQQMIPNWDIEPVVQNAVQYFRHLAEFGGEHEIYCFLHLYHVLPAMYQQLMAPQLTKAVSSLVVVEESRWGEYVPQPVHFLLHPEDGLWDLSQDALHRNLQYLYNILTTQKSMTVSWQWAGYPQHWPMAKQQWKGVLTLRALRTLHAFSSTNLQDVK